MNSSPNPDQPPPDQPVSDHQETATVAADDWLELLNDPQDSRGFRSRWLCRLLETGPQPFAMIDLQQRFIEANQAFGELVGYSRDELLGMSVLDLTAPSRWPSRGGIMPRFWRPARTSG